MSFFYFLFIVIFIKKIEKIFYLFSGKGLKSIILMGNIIRFLLKNKM